VRERSEWSGGASDIEGEGKATRVGESECGQRTSFNRTREAGNLDEIQGVGANMLNAFRNGASPLANSFGFGFIGWLDIRYRLGLAGRDVAHTIRPGGNQALQKTPRVARIMRIYITPCCAEKEEKYQASGELVPPNLLYKSKKTQGFMRQCKVRQVAWAIFSDLYGVWFPEIRHAWYEKDPNSVTDEEFWQLLRNFDESLALYSQICFYHNPGSLHPLHKRLLKETALGDRVKMITRLRDIA